MGIVQSDWQYHDYQGSSKSEAQGLNQKLLAIFSAHPDIITVVARADAGIKTLADLKASMSTLVTQGRGLGPLQKLSWKRSD